MVAKLHIGSLCERDIDLLILEEVATSPRFLSWVLSKIPDWFQIWLGHATINMTMRYSRRAAERTTSRRSTGNSWQARARIRRNQP